MSRVHIKPVGADLDLGQATVFTGNHASTAIVRTSPTWRDGTEAVRLRDVTRTRGALADVFARLWDERPDKGDDDTFLALLPVFAGYATFFRLDATPFARVLQIDNGYQLRWLDRFRSEPVAGLDEAFNLVLAEEIRR